MESVIYMLHITISNIQWMRQKRYSEVQASESYRGGDGEGRRGEM